MGAITGVIGVSFTCLHAGPTKQDGFSMVLNKYESSTTVHDNVVFNHDQHIKRANKDCGQCHYAELTKQSICLLTKGADRRLTPKEPHTNTSHEICFPCHVKDITDAEASSKTCQLCHNQEALKVFKPQTVIYRHSDHKMVFDAPPGCLKCHEKINSKNLKKIAVCSACHKQEYETNVSRRHVRHMFCFECHFAGTERANMSCSFCHNIAADTVYPTLKLIESSGNGVNP